ncbi:LOW QUALITY PROTEIN: sodium/bile acid cotransporter 5 [Glossophaga mutica]
MKNARVKVLKQRQDSLFQASMHMDRNILILILPMILLDKCAFGGDGGYLFALLPKGGITLAILITCTSMVLALIMIPANSYLYSRILGLSGTFHIPVLIIMSPLLFILIPLSSGIVIRSIPEKANVLERIIRPLSFFMSVGIYLMFRLRFLKQLKFPKTVNLDVLLLGIQVPALGFLFWYSFAKISRLPLQVYKTVYTIKSGMLSSFLPLAIIELSLSLKADLASVAPFTVAMYSGCEMLPIFLFTRLRKDVSLS